MQSKQHTVLHMLILAAGAVLAVQLTLLFPVVKAIRFSSVGSVSAIQVYWFLMAIMAVSAVLGLYSLLNVSVIGGSLKKRKRLYLLPLLAGSLLASMGIIVINLSNSVVSGVQGPIMAMMGLQLAALGILSLTSFITAKGGYTCLIKNVPNYSILLFFVLLVPAAFII